MATPLKIVAQHVIDLFYQDYKSTSQFWDVEDGMYFAGVAYGDLLGQEYMAQYKEMRAMREEGIVQFSHDWLQTEDLKIKDGEDGPYVELTNLPMSFPFDKQDVGIQNVFVAGSKFKGEIVRSTIDSIWQDKYLPNTTTIFWALLQNKIYFKSTQAAPPPAVKVVYVPEVSDNLKIPNSRENMIVQMAVQLMLKAKEGNLVKEVNDQNKNVAPVTEMDRNLIK